MRLGLAIYAALSSALLTPLALTEAYDGPDDPAAFRVPERLDCIGVERYPEGIDIYVPWRAVIGNLIDGLQYLYPGGKVEIIVFNFFGEGGSDTVEFIALRGQVYGSHWTKSKGSCQVESWHPE